MNNMTSSYLENTIITFIEKGAVLVVIVW